MTIAHTAHPSTREKRALELYRERGHLIRAVAANTYEVPSQRMIGKRYEVRYGGTVEERCSCPDWLYNGDRGPCKHLLMVGIAHAKRRSGVREVRTSHVAAGDPFKAAGLARHLDDLEERYRHELVPEEERAELRDRVLALRRRLGR